MGNRNDSNCYKRLEKLTILNAAPVIRGVKPSGLLCLGCGLDPLSYKQWKDSLAPHIKAYPLYSCKGQPVMLLYREERLKLTLSSKRAKALLAEQGYNIQASINDILVELKRRFGAYVKGLRDFPHEVGVILGYPPEDVISYMRDGGKSSLMTKYWKVYNNPAKAHRTFRLFDKAKKEVYSEYNSGMDITNIMRMDCLHQACLQPNCEEHTYLS